MFNDVDETLKLYFTADLPITGGEIDVSFERPTREWSGRLSRPTLNCFLYDIRERAGFVDETPTMRPGANGSVIRQRPPRRIDLSYMITAWTREPEDEHRILGRTLASMHRVGEIPPTHFQGALQHSKYPLLARIAPAEHVSKPADMWGVLDNELRTSLVWILTTPLEAFGAVEGPLVRTREIRIGDKDADWRETFTQVAGTARKKGEPDSTLAGVRVSVAGTAHTAVTRDDGRYSFSAVPRGDHVLKFESADGKSGEQTISVPSDSYDIEL
jgi:hypothetical protein